MSAIALSAFMQDAPAFRIFEGIIGARYHAKDPDRPLAPGLWFADVPERMEIATHFIPEGTNNVTMEDIEPSTRDSARSHYTFRRVIVQPGDALIRDYLHFDGARTPVHIKEILADMNRLYEDMHQNGAEILLHIPREEFWAGYDYDDAKKEYRKKPFHKKLTTQTTTIETSDGTVEVVPPYADVIMQGQTMQVWRDGMFPGYHERLIGGETLNFQLQRTRVARNQKPGLLDIMPISAGLSYRMMPGGVEPNPYAVLKGIFGYAAGVFREDGCPLSSAELHDFENHHRDLELRHDLFEIGLTKKKPRDGATFELRL